MTGLVESQSVPALPPILSSRITPEVRERVEQFYFSVAAIFESWVARRQSKHTQRAYREDIMAFVHFAGIRWPEDAVRLLQVSIMDVQAFRDRMQDDGAAPKTLNRCISSLSSFYKYLHGAAAELRLLITVPNPAHAKFISRESADARDETRALSVIRARQLMSLPSGESVLEYCDRAILKLFIYSGIRLGTGCRLKVEDFHLEDGDATIRIHEKGDKRRMIGLNPVAGQAIEEYIQHAGITSGPVFHPRRASGSEKLAQRAMDEVTPYRIILISNRVQRFKCWECDGKPHSYVVMLILLGTDLNPPTALDGIGRIHNFCDHMFSAAGVCCPLDSLDAFGQTKVVVAIV